jgi:hypothetical protein
MNLKKILLTQKSEKKLFNVHRKPGDVTRVDQKPASIFQLIDLLENVTEKLQAE